MSVAFAAGAVKPVLTVVGAGIVGLAHALAGAKAGFSVHLYDASPAAAGASVRNFGLVIPLGQHPSASKLSARSRAVWGEVARAAGLRMSACGSLTLAHAPDELAVLHEAVAAAAPGSGLKILTPAETYAASPGVARGTGLLGALASPSEAVIDSAAAVRALPAWLARAHGVVLHLGVAVRAVNTRGIVTDQGEMAADAIVVCGGAADAARGAHALCPDVYARVASAGALARVRLQMLRTVPQPTGWLLGPALAGGLTLARYAAFAGLPGVADLRARLAAERPIAARHDIHVLVTQMGNGALTIGDSHASVPADAPEEWLEDEDIYAEILDNARRLLDAPRMAIASRWSGTYLKAAGRTHIAEAPASLPRVRVVNGLGGAGMTLSFAIAEQVIAELRAQV